MSIQSKIRIIDKIQKIVSELLVKYTSDANVHSELEKINESLLQLKNYLNGLDQLKPDYDTNHINQFVEAINLNLVILSNMLEKSDYVRLRRGMTTIKTILKFHPTKHSYIEFIISWIIEFFYFI